MQTVLRSVSFTSDVTKSEPTTGSKLSSDMAIAGGQSLFESRAQIEAEVRRRVARGFLEQMLPKPGGGLSASDFQSRHIAVESHVARFADHKELLA